MATKIFDSRNGNSGLWYENYFSIGYCSYCMMNKSTSSIQFSNFQPRSICCNTHRITYYYSWIWMNIFTLSSIEFFLRCRKRNPSTRIYRKIFTKNMITQIYGNNTYHGSCLYHRKFSPCSRTSHISRSKYAMNNCFRTYGMTNYITTNIKMRNHQHSQSLIIFIFISRSIGCKFLIRWSNLSICLE